MERQKKSIVRTIVVVDSGIYTVVRHPLISRIYIFVHALVLMCQHWLGVSSWIMGSSLFCKGVGREEQMTIDKFGDDYKRHMEKVLRMNLLLGAIRWRSVSKHLEENHVAYTRI